MSLSRREFMKALTVLVPAAAVPWLPRQVAQEEQGSGWPFPLNSPWRPDSGYVALLGWHGEEVTGGGYERAHYTDPNRALHFGPATEGWGLVSGFAVLNEDGICLYHGDFVEGHYVHVADDACLDGGVPFMRWEAL